LKKAVLAAGLLAAAAGSGAFLWRQARSLLNAVALPESWEGAAFEPFFGGSEEAVSLPVGGDIELRLGRVSLAEDLQAENLSVRLVPAEKERGEFAQIVIESEALTFRGLTLTGVSLQGRGARLDVPALIGRKKLRFARLDELLPKARLGVEALAAWSADVRVAPAPGGLTVEGTWRGRPWRGRVELALAAVLGARARAAPAARARAEDVFAAAEPEAAVPHPAQLFDVRLRRGGDRLTW
jgi:hypothetical protein